MKDSIESPGGSKDLRREIGRRTLTALLCFSLGVAVARFLVRASGAEVATFLFAFGGCCLAWFLPDLALAGLFVGIIFMTELVHGDLPIEIFAISDIDVVEGLPSALILYFLCVFFVVFFRKYAIEHQRSVIPERYLFVFLGVLAIATMTGLLEGGGFVQIRMDFMKMLFPVLCFYLCANVLDRLSRIRRFLCLFFAASAVHAVVLDAYYLAGRGYPFGHSSGDSLQIVTYDGADNMAFITMSVLVCSLLLSGQVPRRKLALVGIATVPMVFSVLFSFRRTQWLGVFVSLVILVLILSSRERRRAPLLGAIILVGVVSAILWLAVAPGSPSGEKVGEQVKTRFLSIFDPQQRSNRYHVMEAKRALADIAERPLLGLGLGGAHGQVGLWREDSVSRAVVHNTWIHVWMKTGLPGLVFLVWIAAKYVRLIWRFRRVPESWSGRPVGLGLAATSGLWFVHFLTGPVPFYYHMTFQIALFSAILVVLTRLAPAEDENLAPAPSLGNS